MRPILRLLPLGGFLLALLILVLALVPPDRLHRIVAPGLMTARGPLIDRDEHPEWRQFVFRAALRRADELNHLGSMLDNTMQAGSILPSQDPVLLNKPIVELSPAASLVPIQAISPENKFESADEPRVEDTPKTATSLEPGSGTVEEASHADAPIVPLAPADTSQALDANPSDMVSKRHRFIRRGTHAKAQQTQAAAVRSNFLNGIFGDSPSTPRKTPVKRRRLKTAAPPSQANTQAAVGQTSTEANNGASGNAPVTENKKPDAPKPIAKKAQRARSAQKSRRQPQANPSPTKGEPETNSGAG
jgi:hypothetical protein